MDLDTLAIDELAWYGKKMPKDATRLEQLYYHVARSIYIAAKNGTVELIDAKALKGKLLAYFESVLDLAASSGRLICELDKLAAPTAELESKSREELLEIVLKMLALCSGLMKKAEDKVPEFMRRGRANDTTTDF